MSTSTYDGGSHRPTAEERIQQWLENRQELRGDRIAKQSFRVIVGLIVLFLTYLTFFGH